VLIVYTIGFAALVTQPPIGPDGGAQPRSAELLANFDRGLHWLLTGITGATA